MFFWLEMGCITEIKRPVFCGFLKETAEQVTCFECRTAEMVACLIIQNDLCMYLCMCSSFISSFKAVPCLQHHDIECYGL